ncbi:hypothetical protein [Dickeya undicola]|uniref:hypothetical protein n=1 Tax=Dickeya undicola TaxID=1577887 RepID=UPI0011CD57DD|nr:hypothetical protein [Dickeya undicola]
MKYRQYGETSRYTLSFLPDDQQGRAEHKSCFYYASLGDEEGRFTSMFGVNADAFSYQMAVSAMTDRQLVTTIGNIH